jgi:hypothetical protein
MAWDAPLSRVLSPKGERLVTLRGGDVPLRTLRRRRADAVLEHAIALLMKAAESGELADRKTATDQVARVLQRQRLI